MEGTVCTDHEQIRKQVESGYHQIGHLLDHIAEPAILVDAQCKDYPIVGVSRGFCGMSGFNWEHCKGKNCRMMFDGVPSVAISRSSRKNVANFCNMCQVDGLETISEVAALQPNSRKDGSHFVNMFVLGLCKAEGRQYILGVQKNLGEGLCVRLSRSQHVEETESLRTTLHRLRSHVCTSPLTFARSLSLGSIETPELTPVFKFYTERLQDHCMLMNNGLTAVRREPEELAFNCLNFGDRPVGQCPEGLKFTLRVDEVTESFKGLPVLGFTKRKPTDTVDLFPGVTRCLGSSVLIGADGEAFARDQQEHFKIGFKKPPPDEVRHWAMQPDIPGTQPVIKSGDLISCVYFRDGRLELQRNSETIMSFDTERPVDSSMEYYAVVDVCLSACSLTIVPSSGSGLACKEVDSWKEDADGSSTVSTCSQSLSENFTVSSPSCDGHGADVTQELAGILKRPGEPSAGQSSKDGLMPSDLATPPRPAACEKSVRFYGVRQEIPSCCRDSDLSSGEATKPIKSANPAWGLCPRGSSDVLAVTVGVFVLCGTLFLLPGKLRRR